jgi:hypothetical protein
MIDDESPLLPLVLGPVPGSLHRALEQEGVPVASWKSGAQTAGAVAGRFVVFDSRLGRCGPIDPRQTAIDIDGLRRGQSPDPLAALDDTRSARRSWQIGQRLVSEEVARYDKRILRQRLMARLRGLVESAGGVWMRLAPFPYPYRSAFNFRLDHDQYRPDDFDRVLQATSGYEHALSHFVAGASFEGQPAALERLRQMDVGSHGYRHHTYRQASENLRNIARGIDVLRQAGIEPSGFASPHGRWPAGFARVLDALGISHSSEFGLAYDDLPFFPDRGNVLQIPVHPVCLGICLEASDRAGGGPTGRARAADELAEYFQQAAAARHRAGEPLFFYGHPDGRLGQYPDVLRRLLGTVSQLPALWPTSLTEFGSWWRARSRTRIRVYRDDQRVRVVASGRPRAYPLAVEYFQGDQVASVPLESDELRFSPGALAYRRSLALPAAGVAHCTLPKSLRSSVLRYFDWEKETPVEEIATDHWRGWVKHKLREWRVSPRSAVRELVTDRIEESHV